MSSPTGGVLLAEAGTGTGKTLAYLVPAILSRQRVLVSTGTKNLQEQIFFKDLPVLREALGIPFTATCMKGRGNYLCLHRFEAFRESARHPLVRRDAAHPHPRALVAETETGDRAEIEDLPEDLPFWRDIAATSENCLGAECPQLQRLLRRQDAPARRRIRRRHRQPPPALRRRCRAAERLRRSHPALHATPSSTRRTSSRTWRRSTSASSVSNYRFDDFVRDVDRAIGARADPRRRAPRRDRRRRPPRPRRRAAVLSALQMLRFDGRRRRAGGDARCA